MPKHAIQIIPADATGQISANDRSFNYGDAVFTTIAVRAGVAQLWPLHLARLQCSVRQLGFAEPDWLALEQAVNSLVTAADNVIKVVISRGLGGRGYSPDPSMRSQVYISQAHMPDYQQWKQQGVRLKLAELRLSVQPRLAGLKHNNRLEQVLLKQELALADTDELLVADQQGFITEATASNVFIYWQGRWQTPMLDRAGVAGVMRQQLLTCRPEIVQADCPLSALPEIEAMVLTNALMQAVPVRELAGRPLNLVLARQLQHGLLC
ncbi:aminodeoxychorismate lyase [Arsukibacterium sp.]|uniref:aminodeoxychorismate lyase n=1 Tax=Arsukibacterium sp. TaxID=1977258 RepID=UPI002FDA2AA8